MFDITHHNLSPAQLKTTYGINYNTIRNIFSLFQNQEGETYKHSRMYKDINNVFLKLAMINDRSLAETIRANSEKCNKERNLDPKVSSLYLYLDNEGQDLKVFCLQNDENIQVEGSKN